MVPTSLYFSEEPLGFVAAPGRAPCDGLQPDILLHRIADTAANIATASGRHSEGTFIPLSSIPPCPPPWVVEMLGSTYSVPAQVIRSTVDTHSPSRRLLRTLEQGGSNRLVSARGIKLAADGMIHSEATELLHTQTPSHVMDAGLRGALGRSACTLQNLVSVAAAAPKGPAF